MSPPPPYLKETGAKMYGAFWCSHCEDQKETFGAGASDLPYVEVGQCKLLGG